MVLVKTENHQLFPTDHSNRQHLVHVFNYKSMSSPKCTTANVHNSMLSVILKSSLQSLKMAQVGQLKEYTNVLPSCKVRRVLSKKTATFKFMPSLSQPHYTDYHINPHFPLFSCTSKTLSSPSKVHNLVKPLAL